MTHKPIGYKMEQKLITKENKSCDSTVLCSNYWLSSKFWSNAFFSC